MFLLYKLKFDGLNNGRFLNFYFQTDFSRFLPLFYSKIKKIETQNRKDDSMLKGLSNISIIHWGE